MKLTEVVTEGFTDRAPRVNAFTSLNVAGMGNAATKPSLPVLVAAPAAGQRHR